MSAGVLFTLKRRPADEKGRVSVSVSAECSEPFKHLVLCVSETHSPSVAPLQRSFREMNAADTRRGAGSARLTDFITVNGTCFHNLWSSPSLFHANTNTGGISMHHMSCAGVSLSSQVSCALRRSLFGRMLLVLVCYTFLS